MEENSCLEHVSILHRNGFKWESMYLLLRWDGD